MRWKSHQRAMTKWAYNLGLRLRLEISRLFQHLRMPIAHLNKPVVSLCQLLYLSRLYLLLPHPI
jgi:hypothetical protein